MKKIAVFGCGGHAISVVDTIKKNKEYEILGFVDKAKSDYSYAGIPVIATDDYLDSLNEREIEYGVLGIGFVHGNDSVRMKVYKNAADSKIRFPVIKDESSVVSGTAKIGNGTFIGKGAIINAEAIIGECCIINTGAIVEHCVHIGNNTHAAVGCVICGGVVIGNNCLIGANSTIIQGIKIGNNVTIGAGSVVINDVPDGETFVGNPARMIGNGNDK